MYLREVSFYYYWNHSKIISSMTKYWRGHYLYRIEGMPPSPGFGAYVCATKCVVEDKVTTHFETYHTRPLSWTKTSLFGVVTWWNDAVFSLLKNTSGIQIFVHPSSSSFNLVLLLLRCGSNARRLSFHCWRRYMLSEKSCTAVAASAIS